MFLDAKGNVLLGDWGYAAPWSLQRMKRRPCGSLNYAPSEILHNKKYYGPEVDIFALGGCLYTMLTGKLPFGYAKTKETYERVTTGAWRLDSCLTNLEIQLLDKLFAPNPLDRATMADIKKFIGRRKEIKLGSSAISQQKPSPSSPLPDLKDDVVPPPYTPPGRPVSPRREPTKLRKTFLRILPSRKNHQKAGTIGSTTHIPVPTECN